MITGSKSIVGWHSMFAVMSRLFGGVIIGVCLSTFTTLLIALMMMARNLPQILIGFQKVLRSLLGSSFRLYNILFRPLRVWVFRQTGFDINHVLSRTLISIVFSMLIGIGFLSLLSWRLQNWQLFAFLVHGLFIGLAWESILYPDEFQLGVNR